jgi:hypothetical protein
MDKSLPFDSQQRRSIDKRLKLGLLRSPLDRLVSTVRIACPRTSRGLTTFHCPSPTLLFLSTCRLLHSTHFLSPPPPAPVTCLAVCSSWTADPTRSAWVTPTHSRAPCWRTKYRRGSLSAPGRLSPCLSSGACRCGSTVGCGVWDVVGVTVGCVMCGVQCVVGSGL